MLRSSFNFKKMRNKKLLITTGNYLRAKNPVIFLGNWCLNHTNKNLWENMDYEVFESKLFTHQNNLILNETSKNIYEKLLEELTNELNNFHKLKWTKTSWRILIGPWLYRYISVLNLKIDQLKEIKNQYPDIEIEEINVEEELNLAFYDLEDFSDKLLTHKYNKYLYFRIFNFLNKKNNNITNNITSINLPGNPEPKEKIITKIKNFTIKIIERLFCFKNEFIFYKPYIGNFLCTIKLILKLKEFPFKYNINEKRFFFKFNHIIRDQLNLIINDKQLTINEKIIRHQLKESIPTIYLEGFKEMFNKIDVSFFPKKRKFIYTCSLYSDTLFKFWAAKQVNNGTKIIYGQHGGNTNFSTDEFKTDHEIDISEKYITWGWSSKDSKTIKGYCFPIISKSSFKKKNSGKYLLVTHCLYHYHFYNKISFFNEISYGEKEFVLSSTKNIYDFLSNNDFINQLEIRLHPNDYRTETPIKPILEENFNNLVYDTSKDALKSFNNYDLIFFTYFEATPFLQCLALNKPCMAFIPSKENTLNKSNFKYWDLFLKNGIIHEDADSAKKKIKEIKNDIKNWWWGEKIQSIISEFTQENAYKFENSITRVSKILKTIKRKNNEININ